MSNSQSDRAWQDQAYGCPEATLQACVENSPIAHVPGHLAMTALSMLSDAQELLAVSNPAAARQKINQAKWVIGTYWLKPAVDDQQREQAPAAG